jgi:hypothetical protein
LQFAHRRIRHRLHRAEASVRQLLAILVLDAVGFELGYVVESAEDLFFLLLFFLYFLYFSKSQAQTQFQTRNAYTTVHGDSLR